MGIQVDEKGAITIAELHQDRRGLSTLYCGSCRRARKRQVRIAMQIWPRSYAGCGDHGI
jgi:hypothetical protein